jgi:hypothetical protein
MNGYEAGERLRPGDMVYIGEDGKLHKSHPKTPDMIGPSEYYPPLVGSKEVPVEDRKSIVFPFGNPAMATIIKSLVWATALVIITWMTVGP